MERIRAAAATVAIISPDNSFAEQLVALIADDATTVVLYTLLAALLAALNATAPDAVVIADDEARDAADDLRQIRRRLPAVQVLYMCVATEKRTMDLLNWGADDAVVSGSPTLKPRLQAVTRRARTLNAQTRISVGDIVFDRESRRVWCAGKEVELTPHEFAVVDCLFWHAPNAVDFATLSMFVWGEASADRKSLVQVYVSYVRRKLSPSRRVGIQFTRGAGYSFVEKE
jgi:two-component system OmpR family response regulator